MNWFDVNVYSIGLTAELMGRTNTASHENTCKGKGKENVYNYCLYEMNGLLSVTKDRFSFSFLFLPLMRYKMFPITLLRTIRDVVILKSYRLGCKPKSRLML